MNQSKLFQTCAAACVCLTLACTTAFALTPAPVTEVTDLPADAAFTAMDIQLSENYLTVRQGDSFSLAISEKMKPYAQYRVEDGVFYFKDSRVDEKNRRMMTKAHDYTVSITVPKGTDLTDLDLACGVGDVQVSSLRMNRVELTGGVGDLSMDGIAITESFKLNSGVGDSVIKGDLRGSVTITGGVGDVSLSLDGAEQDYSVSADTGVGDVRVGDRKWNMFSPPPGDVNPKADNKIKIRGGVGDIAVTFNAA